MKYVLEKGKRKMLYLTYFGWWIKRWENKQVSQVSVSKTCIPSSASCSLLAQ